VTPEQTGFIAKVAPAAMETQRQTGVPAPITIAQCILESGWGKTKLAALHNNFFGIKATKQDIREGHYVEYQTDEQWKDGQLHKELAYFDSYPSFTDCFLEHARLLQTPNYERAMAVKDDLSAFAHMLGPKPEGCGYSTASDYGDKLMELIRLYNLEEYLG
jgi:flagellar protein FlgJ